MNQIIEQTIKYRALQCGIPIATYHAPAANIKFPFPSPPDLKEEQTVQCDAKKRRFAKTEILRSVHACPANVYLKGPQKDVEC